jgi:hypothetical protein
VDNEALTADFFRSEDAEGVRRLFTEIYGNEYPAKIVYHPDQLITAFEHREQIPIVVRTADNRIVGYSSLFRVAPDKGVYEKGNGAVLPEFRNAGIMKMIFCHVKQTLPQIHDLRVLFGEPVCNHIYIQKAALDEMPFIETALEVDFMPAEAYVQEKSASGRVSTLLMFITVVPKPHTVYVPEVYEDCFRYIYDGLDDTRTLSRSGDDLPLLQATLIDTLIFDFARVARLTVHEAGADLETAFVSAEGRMMNRGVQVIQVLLKLSWPWICRVVGFLKGRGYFFGGVLPQWFGEDGLLIQKVLMRPNWEGIHVFSERAQKILELVKADFQG